MKRRRPWDDHRAMNRSEELARALGARPWIVGHRGAAGLALENTLPAIAAGLEQGACMIEVDVQLTADLEPVVVHDWDLRRLAGRSEIVERTDRERLLAVEIRPIGETRSPTGRIPLLEDVLEAVPAGIAINLEVKLRLHSPVDVVRVLEPFIERRRAILLSSFEWGLLGELRRRWPDVPLAPIARYRPDELLETAERLDAFSIHVHRELAPVLLERTSPAQRPLLVYTVNDEDEARRLVARDVAGLFTDSPGLMRAALTDDG